VFKVPDAMKLYTYFRSSAAYRVRIALNLKGLSYEPHFVHLLRAGGEQHAAPYRALNPQGLVPALIADGAVLVQSLAIIEYLEEIHPTPPLLPAEPRARARVRALALLIACDIHPLNNLRVMNYLRDELKQDTAARKRWICHWIAQGFAALEQMLTAGRPTGTFCHGERPTLADVCLVPQLANALRYDCDLSAYPTVRRIADACMQLDAFRQAAPEHQPDVEV
jgi:maleylacetoacetate isomerase